MAKASWCTVAPMSGSGNSTLTISGSNFQGNTARNTTVTVTNQKGSKPTKTFTVNQKAASIFFTVTSPSSTQVNGYDGGELDYIANTNMNFGNDSYWLGVLSERTNASNVTLEQAISYLRDISGVTYIDISGGKNETLGFINYEADHIERYGQSNVKFDNGYLYLKMSSVFGSKAVNLCAANPVDLKIEISMNSNLMSYDVPYNFRIASYNSSTQAFAQVGSGWGLTLTSNSTLSLSATSLELEATGAAKTLNVISNDDWAVS